MKDYCGRFVVMYDGNGEAGGGTGRYGTDGVVFGTAAATALAALRGGA